MGSTVLLLMLGTGIAVGLKSRKLTVTELVICGVFGGLLFTVTSMGPLLRTSTDNLGSQIVRMIG